MKNKKSYWIWNYGDYEIFHSNKLNSRREEFGADYPCFWRLSAPDVNVKFYCDFEAEEDGVCTLFVNGFGNLVIDDGRYPSNAPVAIRKGKHRAEIAVTNLTGLPAAYLQSDCLRSGESWYTVDGDQNTIPVGYDKYYDSADKNPEVFPFAYARVYPAERTKTNGGLLFAFEKELFGFLYVENADEKKTLHISYGESKEEALDLPNALLFENVSGKQSYKLRQRAFRYIFIPDCDDEPTVFADLEYLPLQQRGKFRCDDENVNKIWEVCAYTLSLTTREVLSEAIKRDGWLWGGDAYQAYKFSNYLYFDKEIVRRSTIALRGKDPFVEHINTIADYSLYWVIGLKDYLLNFNDLSFVEFIYPRAVSLMDFCKKRVNKEGFITKKGADWIFVDWSDIDKDGAVCAEQMLWIEANKTMAYLAKLLQKDGTEYEERAKTITKKVNEYFWDEEKGAFIDCYESGKRNVTRHANIFAVLYDIATEEQRKSIQENVFYNEKITPVTTPYFEGFQLDVFGKIGDFDYIERKIKSYWQGMIDLGATTVWEEYDPTKTGVEHYAMYGSKYAKSLCHAWGAAPIYLFGKYFLGVTPRKNGFEKFTVRPHLGGFRYIDGIVPIQGGEVAVYLSEKMLRVRSTKSGGTLVWQGKTYPLTANETFELAL